jgi:hypothetical protein
MLCGQLIRYRWKKRKKANGLASSGKSFAIAAVPSFPGDWLHELLLSADHGAHWPELNGPLVLPPLNFTPRSWHPSKVQVS